MAEVFRMCAVCRKKYPKTELLRIVKSPSGKIYIDESSKADGRGMYICKDKACLQGAAKKKAVERSFKMRAEDIYEKLAEFSAGGDVK